MQLIHIRYRLRERLSLSNFLENIHGRLKHENEHIKRLMPPTLRKVAGNMNLATYYVLLSAIGMNASPLCETCVWVSHYMVMTSATPDGTDCYLLPQIDNYIPGLRMLNGTAGCCAMNGREAQSCMGNVSAHRNAIDKTESMIEKGLAFKVTSSLLNTRFGVGNYRITRRFPVEQNGKIRL